MMPAEAMPLLPDRLPFVLPEWTRIAWVSSEARAVWEPRVAAITAAWTAIERWSVADGVRPSARQIVAPEDLPALMVSMAALDLIVVPLGREASRSTYAASPQAPQPGQAWVYRVAITRAELASLWRRADVEQDPQALGVLLGYPECCAAFFERVWVEGKCVDTTWAQAEPSGVCDLIMVTDDGIAPNRLVVSGPPEANLLLRWLGVRLVPHLPCSWACVPTAALGKQLAAVGRAHGYAREVDWIEEMLNWPVSWSALHGIAEIRTPVCTISTRTDATAGELTVRRKGPGYPAEGAVGFGFPYRTADGQRLTETQAYRSAFVPIDVLRRKAAPAPPKMNEHEAAMDDRWTDNGFSSQAAMDSAHAIVVEVVQLAKPDNGPVVDLGCGDGALLRRLLREGVITSGLGVECDAARVSHGRERQDATGPILIHEDLFDYLAGKLGHASAVLLMPGRLIEVPSRADMARRALASWTDTLVVYAYNDWLDRHASLESLCRAAGLTGRVDGQRVGPGVAVGIWRWA